MTRLQARGLLADWLAACRVPHVPHMKNECCTVLWPICCVCPTHSDLHHVLLHVSVRELAVGGRCVCCCCRAQTGYRGCCCCRVLAGCVSCYSQVRVAYSTSKGGACHPMHVLYMAAQFQHGQTWSVQDITCKSSAVRCNDGQSGNVTRRHCRHAHQSARLPPPVPLLHTQLLSHHRYPCCTHHNTCCRETTTTKHTAAVLRTSPAGKHAARSPSTSCLPHRTPVRLLLTSCILSTSLTAAPPHHSHTKPQQTSHAAAAHKLPSPAGGSSPASAACRSHSA